MAGQTHLIDIPGAEEPWAVLAEVALVTPPESWVLVGGLMVQAHSLRAGIQTMRSTRDVDLLIDIASASVGLVAGPLQQIGFEAVKPGLSPFIHRFVRGDDVVDVMVERGRGTPRWHGHAIFQTSAARQAIERQDRYEVRIASESVIISVPDALGAVVVKSAAYRDDNRDRGRHLEDLVNPARRFWRSARAGDGSSHPQGPAGSPARIRRAGG